MTTEGRQMRDDETEATVLQVGPALSVRGGIAAVERLVIDHASDGIAMRQIATVEEGTNWVKLHVFVRALITLRRELRRETPLVVHVHFASRGSTVRKCIASWLTLRARRPLILHAHGAEFDRFFLSLPRVFQRAVRTVFARADCFVVVSTQWREFYTRHCGVSPSRVVVLGNPVVVPARTTERKGRRVVQFLFLGRTGTRKGAFDLLHAFGALPDELRARARLVFAGDGAVDTLREQSKIFADRIDVHDWLDSAQRDALLEASDVFVLPSHAEGVPMAMLEAMAHGLPVVTTAVGGIPDIVTNGCEGLVVKPGDPVALCDALQTLIESEPLRLKMGQCARLRAQKNDITAYSAHLTQIYRRLTA
jgi:glycosyltransferase involved in cell wall biosynthesis